MTIFDGNTRGLKKDKNVTRQIIKKKKKKSPVKFQNFFLSKGSFFCIVLYFTTKMFTAINQPLKTTTKVKLFKK